MKISNNFFSCTAALLLISCSISDPTLPTGLTQASITQIAEPVEDTDSNDLSGRPTSAGEKALARTDALIPYQINFDATAYMNCPGDAAANDAVFFTLKFGAYRSGLQLHPDFKNFLANMSLEEKKQQLESSPLIKSRAQLSLSSTGYPSQIRKTSQGHSVVDILTLNHPSVLSSLAKDGASYSLGHNASVEMNLLYPGNSFFNLLPSLNTKYSVYLTYNNGSNVYPLSPGQGRHYGRYFNLDFSSKAKFLMQVAEYDLQDETSKGSWICPDHLRFAVHREFQSTLNFYKENRDWFNKNKLSAEWACYEDSSVLSEWEGKLFSLLIKNRTFIYGKTIKWVKDSSGTNQPVYLNRKCIAPTNPAHSCYNDQHTFKVEFEESKCDPRNKTKVCPAYLSLCFKQSP